MDEMLGLIFGLFGEGFVAIAIAPGNFWFRIMLGQNNPKPMSEFVFSIGFYIALAILILLWNIFG